MCAPHGLMFACLCVSTPTVKLIMAKALGNSFHPQLEIIELPIQARAQWHRPPVFYMQRKREAISMAISINRPE